jgi:hypothetical protein
MRPCGVCGNDIEDSARRCRYCDAEQTGARERGTATGRRRKLPIVSTVNLKVDVLTPTDAVEHLEQELMGARTLGTRVIRVIHGYGSSGSGGAVKGAVRRRLPALQRSGFVRAFVPGEDYSETGEGARALLSRCPELRAGLATDRVNPGLTFIELAAPRKREQTGRLVR